MANETKRPVLSIRAKRGDKKPEGEDNLSSAATDIVTPPDEGVTIRTVMATVEEGFNAFGTEALPGTVVPCGQRNNTAEAAEYVLANKLVKLATDRLKKATEAAEKAGVFGDSSMYVEGDSVMVFSDPNFTISVKMGKPSKLINREAVEEAAAELLGKKAEEFLLRCYKPRKATSQIIVSMK